MEQLGSSYAYSKKWKERGELKKELLNKEEPELEDLEYSHSVHGASLRKDWRQEEKGTTEDEMVGWHHWLNGHEYE